MGWLNDATSAIGWLAAEAVSGRDPQQLQQGFQQLGITASDFLSWYGYAQSQTPAPGTAMGAGSFGDLSQWLTTAPAAKQPGVGKPPATAQQSSALGKPKNLSDAQWATAQGVLRAAQELGIPAPLALAMAYKESGFNSGATGDHGCSKGALQLNTCDGEGVGLPDYVLSDPYLNARVSFTKLRQVMQANPGMSWGELAAAAQRPEDAAGYAQTINGYISGLQTGQGPLGWAQSTVTGTLSQRQNLPGGSNQVPLPFSTDYFSNITEPFGEDGEMGTDFGMPEGQTITSPVGGTITTRDDGNRNWGRAVYVKMPNGWTFFVGHLMDFAVQDGQVIAPGQVLGSSGGGPQSPSPGHSTGPHIEIRFIDPSGQNQDPMGFLQPLFHPNGSGASASNLFSNWMGGLFQGSAQVTPSQAQQSLVMTPDKRLLDLNSATGMWYQAVDNVWRSVFGMHAPLQAALDFQHAGISTTQGIQDAVNGLPSGIVPGVSIGQFNSLDQAVNSAANQAFGRPVPQSLIKDFFQRGVTSTSDVKLWFNTHSSSDIPPGEYQTTFDAMNTYTQAVWGDSPHPTDVAEAWAQAGGSTPTEQLPAQDQVAKTISDYGAGVF